MVRSNLRPDALEASHRRLGGNDRTPAVLNDAIGSRFREPWGASSSALSAPHARGLV